MDYYYELELYQGTGVLGVSFTDKLIHSQVFNSEEELVDVFKKNGKRYIKFNVVPQVLRFDKKERFVVVLEKGYDQGYEYYKFYGKDALQALKEYKPLRLYNSTGDACSVVVAPGIGFMYSRGDYTQYFSRPWSRHDSVERAKVLVSEAKSYLDALKSKYCAEDFNPYIYRDHSFSVWSDSFVNAVRESLKEQVD